jgi:small subunit ribosomal protein S30
MISNLCKYPGKNELFACTRIIFRSLSTSLDEEYSTEPQYPPILDVSRAAEHAREVQAWHNKIKNLGTVEEKLIEVNMPKYYGWKCNMSKEGEIPYNALTYAQHITRTHFIEGLPTFYQSQQLDEAAKQYTSEIKSQFTEALLYELQRFVCIVYVLCSTYIKYVGCKVTFR